MAQLLCKTRGGSSPQGKPRVYFACHPQDFSAYFEEISGELLDISNCAVYYNDGETAVDEDFYLNLGQMQLIVMPITTRLLYTPSIAMDEVLPYAEVHHIPVLPLMQEKDLERCFNEKFGDLQFLDKHNEDPTALPYDEKLKKYLEAVLVGDELARKVREAFDAYIFLSYRKKDRKYAQELMRLIHRSDFCRDIAIWYDEFLSPGENFNGAIRDALEKSSLFALAVTPNLVNEVNYVMTTEYPMAMEAGKPILAAELVDTDKEALRSSYEQIPDCVDPRDQAALNASLVERLQQLAIRENDKDPQHNFFIGLAYLSGIDVEVDHERAVELITGAAEAGLTEAMEKLVSMYENGEGVKRDYHTAISWREKLTQQAKAWYEQTGTEHAAKAFLRCLLELGDAWNAVADISSAKAVYRSMCDFAQILLDAGFTQSKLYLSVAYSRMGDVSRAEHDMPGAKQWQIRSMELLEENAANGSSDVQWRLAIRYEKIGQICEWEGDLNTARTWYTKAIRIYEKQAQTGSVTALEDLAYAYANMGSTYCYMQRSVEPVNLPEALRWFGYAVEIREKLASPGDQNSWAALSRSYADTARVYLLKREMDSAKLWFAKALELGEKAAQTERVADLAHLAYLYAKLGSVSREIEDLQGQKHFVQKAMEIRQKLAQTDMIDALDDLALSYGCMEGICIREGDLNGALQWVLKELEIQQKLMEKGRENAESSVAYTYGNLGHLSEKLGDLSGAKQWYIKCAELRIPLAEKGELPDWTFLSDCYSSLGRICKAEGDQQSAGSWYRKARLAQYRGYVKEAECCREQGDLPEAERWYTKAMQLWQKQAEQGGVVAQRSVAVVCNKLGAVAQEQGDFEKARNWYQQDLQIRCTLAELTADVSDRENLAVAYFKSGSIEDRVDYLQSALEIFRQLAEKYPDVGRYGRNAEKIKRKIQLLQEDSNHTTEPIRKKIIRKKKEH